MKRFDLSEIMRNAHRTYKYSGKKQGKTFGDLQNFKKISHRKP